jgi:glucan phosphorylase
MEFGLGEALPIYSGGLGILAGDYLKAASDLGLPVADYSWFLVFAVLTWALARLISS